MIARKIKAIFCVIVHSFIFDSVFINYYLKGYLIYIFMSVIHLIEFFLMLYYCCGSSNNAIWSRNQISLIMIKAIFIND